MLQNTITIIIVFIAGIIALIRFIRILTSPPGRCNGCSQGNGSCMLEGLKREIGETKTQGSSLKIQK